MLDIRLLNQSLMKTLELFIQIEEFKMDYKGEIVTLAVNTLGVLYIVENGNAVQSMADLAGKTIVGAGKGSTPEYALRYLLSENGIDPDKDVVIDWKSEHAECVSALATGAATIALLPQPFVTVAQTKIEGLRMALDLTAEWDALDNGSGMITGVVVEREHSFICFGEISLTVFV